MLHMRCTCIKTNTKSPRDTRHTHTKLWKWERDELILDTKEVGQRRAVIVRTQLSNWEADGGRAMRAARTLTRSHHAPRASRVKCVG